MKRSSRCCWPLKLTLTVALCLALFCAAAGCGSTSQEKEAVSRAPLTEELIDLVESDGQFAALLEKSIARAA